VLKENTKVNKLIQCFLVCLIFLSLLDLVATIYWVSSGEAKEVNPIMAYFIDKSFYLFALAKLSFTFGGIFILDRFKNIFNKLIFNASLFLLLVYAALAGWHIVGVFIHS